MLTALQNRQDSIRSELRLIATTAAMMLAMIDMDCDGVGEAMQSGAETIRSMTEELMENV